MWSRCGHDPSTVAPWRLSPPKHPRPAPAVPARYLSGRAGLWRAAAASLRAAGAAVRSGPRRARGTTPARCSSAAAAASRRRRRGRAGRAAAPACWGAAGARGRRGRAGGRRARAVCCSAAAAEAGTPPERRAAGVRRGAAAGAAACPPQAGPGWAAAAAGPRRWAPRRGRAAGGSRPTPRPGCPGRAAARAPSWAAGSAPAPAAIPGCAGWRRWAGACWAPAAERPRASSRRRAWAAARGSAAGPGRLRCAAPRAAPGSAAGRSAGRRAWRRPSGLRAAGQAAGLPRRLRTQEREHQHRVPGLRFRTGLRLSPNPGTTREPLQRSRWHPDVAYEARVKWPQSNTSDAAIIQQAIKQGGKKRWRTSTEYYQPESKEILDFKFHLTTKLQQKALFSPS